ncbi:hypothetical protein MPER_00444, partial [Moniliophthora perniciosa FA553]
ETLSPGVNTTYISSDAVLFDGIIVCDGTEALFSETASTTTPLFPPERPLNIVRDGFFYGKPIVGIGAGVGAFRNFTTPGQPAQFEEGLRRFKFLDRFPMDSDKASGVD